MENVKTAEPLAEVTQEDREYAADCGRRFLRWTERQIEVTLAGEGDDAALIQALARYRIRAEGRAADSYGDAIREYEERM